MRARCDWSGSRGRPLLFASSLPVGLPVNLPVGLPVGLPFASALRKRRVCIADLRLVVRPAVTALNGCLEAELRPAVLQNISRNRPNR